MNKFFFLKIDFYVFDWEGLKECYVFKFKNFDMEKDCLIIIYFVLVNINFRKYKVLGVLREIEEEKEIVDFDIFDDLELLFLIFNF